MSLEDLPNELVELIVEHSYLVKLASLSDLASVDACISPSLISYARRTPVHALSMVSKSIRHICMPVLYRKLLAKKGVVDAISSGTLHHYLKLNSDRLHLVKCVLRASTLLKSLLCIPDRLTAQMSQISTIFCAFWKPFQA